MMNHPRGAAASLQERAGAAAHVARQLIKNPLGIEMLENALKRNGNQECAINFDGLGEKTIHNYEAIVRALSQGDVDVRPERAEEFWEKCGVERAEYCNDTFLSIFCASLTKPQHKSSC